MPPPVDGSGNSRDQPEQGAHKIYPNGTLHALDVAVTLGVFVNVQLRKVVLAQDVRCYGGSAVLKELQPSIAGGSPTAPKTPNRVIQRMKSMVFQMAPIMPAWRKMAGMNQTTHVTADNEPTTTA